MKKWMGFGIVCIVLWACSGTSHPTSASHESPSSPTKHDTLRIANDSLAYEIVIIEPGFYGWLESMARPRGYYSENFLESRNQLWVREWNSRVNQPSRFDPLLYEIQINYDFSIHYGYEVNYLLYNYFVFFQIRHKQKLGIFDARP